MSGEQCRGYEVDGQPVVVRGDRPLTADDQAALAEIVRAVRARYTDEQAEEMGRRQAAAMARNHERLQRIQGLA